MVAVLSPRTINSRWVTKEIRYALELQKLRGPTYRVIPAMVDGIEPSGLHLWFPEEPVGLKLAIGPGDVQDILPGMRDLSLADDPDLDYDDAAELKLLLERLAHDGKS